jgi:hypothetical protein
MELSGGAGAGWGEIIYATVLCKTALTLCASNDSVRPPLA